MAKRVVEKEDYSTRIAREFCEAIANGTAPWMKPWAAGELQAAYNPTSGKPYRGFNQTYLSFQPYGDPRWMTYKQAEAIGAQVRKGESGTTIEYWQWSEERAVRDAGGNVVTNAEGQTVKQSVELESPKRFYARVFNAEQIDGLPELPPRPVQAEWERHAMAETVLRNSPALITHVEGDRAFYRPSADRITLPLREQFPSADLYYATAFHEIAHSTGHPSRLDRDMAHPFGSDGYAREELVAEIASFMMSQRTGLPFDPGQHHAYVGGWLKALEKDPREIFRAAASAEKAMDFVLGLELAQRVELTQPMTHEHLLARALSDDKILAEALSLTHQLREATVPYQVFSMDDGQNGASLAGFAAQAQADERVEALRTSLLAFSQASPDQARAAALMVRIAIPEQVDRVSIIGGELAFQAGSDEIVAWRDDLTSMIVAEGPQAAIWGRVDELSLDAIRAANAAQYRADFAVAAGLSAYAGIEAQQLADRLSVILDAVAFDGHHELDEIVADQPDMAVLRDDFATFADRSPGHAFLAGVVLYDNVRNTALGNEITPRSVPSDYEVSTRREAVDRQLKVDGLGVVAAEPGLSHWLPDDLSAADFRRETAVLGLSEREQTAALLLGRDIATGMHGVLNDDLPMAMELTTPYEDLLAFAQRGEAQMIAASHVLNLALTVDTDVFGSRLRPDWALAAALVEDRINDIRLQLAETEIREQGREMQAALDAAAEREAAREAADRDDDFHGSGQGDPAKEQTMNGPATQPTQTASERVYLTTKWEDRKAVKAAGAKWDKEAKKWYAEPGADLTPLAAFIPQNQAPEATLTPREEFAEALRAHGLIIDGLPIMDGEFHRVPVDGDTKSGTGKYREKSGTYRGYDDKEQGGHPAGYIQNFRTGKKENWKYSRPVAKISAEDRARQEREAAERKAAREAERLAAHQHLAGLVSQLLDQGAPIPDGHAYLAKKDIAEDRLTVMGEAVDFPPGSEDPQHFGGKDHLLVPAQDIDGKIWTAQAISPTGKKSFPKGARKEGCHHVIGDLDNQRPLLFVEGYATGRDLHQNTTYPVVVCFDAGNLEKVAAEYRARYPERLLVIAGDNDHAKPLQNDEQGRPKPNVGKEKALATAAAINGYALLPDFRPDNIKSSDWNDLRLTEGKDVQLQQLREGMQIAVRQHKAAELTRTGEGARIRADERTKERRREREDERELARDRQVEREPDRAPAMSLAR